MDKVRQALVSSEVDLSMLERTKVKWRNSEATKMKKNERSTAQQQKTTTKNTVKTAGIEEAKKY